MPSKKKLLRAAIAEISAMIDKINADIAASLAQYARSPEEAKRQRDVERKEAEAELRRAYGLDLPSRPDGQKDKA